MANQMLGVELARPGNWRLSSGPRVFSAQNLQDAADFFAASGQGRIPIGFGHTDSRFDGEPAFGWVDNIRYAEDAKGPVLLGDLVDMDDWVAAAAPRRWPNRSVEGFANLDWNGRTYSLALTRLALLGATPPAMPVLRSLADLRQAVAASSAVAASAFACGAQPISASYPAVTDDEYDDQDVIDEDEYEEVAAAAGYAEPASYTISPLARTTAQRFGLNVERVDAADGVFVTGADVETAARLAQHDAGYREYVSMAAHSVAASGVSGGDADVDAEFKHLFPPSRSGPWGRRDPVEWAVSTERIAASARAQWQGWHAADPGEAERVIASLAPVRGLRQTVSPPTAVDAEFAPLFNYPGAPQLAAESVAAAAPAAYVPDPYAVNPVIEEFQALYPGLYRLALRDGPAPTLFETGDVPPFTASGIDPNLLFQLPTMARHPAAETRDKREAQQIFEECAGDPDWAHMQYAAHRGNIDYVARSRSWAAGRAKHRSSGYS